LDTRLERLAAQPAGEAALPSVSGVLAELKRLWAVASADEGEACRRWLDGNYGGADRPERPARQPAAAGAGEG
jgi:hypothetical protein